jgi:predicted AAA+ superfamily ATPase
MIVDREIFKEAKEALACFPILVLTGARQTGKTTLSKLLTNKPYYNLESPDTRELVKSDPRLFLEKVAQSGAIIDEFQRIPELASYLQEVVDNKKENGQFLLTGSNNFLMMESISQSLAGRAAILKLPPFSINEITSFNASYTTDELLYQGFYPAIYSENRNPTKTYDYYYQTYIERDVRQLINIKDLHVFQRFIRLCAGRVGQLVNFEQLASEAGTSAKTIKSWISVLEASYLIYLLPPFFENLNKRVVKSHKLYFYDVGLASYLLGIEEVMHLQNHPLRGSLFENLILSEYLKSRFNNGKSANVFFYRDNHQNEVDMVLQAGNLITLIEIKSAKTYHPSFSKNLDWLEGKIGKKDINKVVLYDGIQEWKSNNFLATNFRNYFVQKP